jgi:hypothetical protein
MAVEMCVVDALGGWVQRFLCLVIEALCNEVNSKELILAHRQQTEHRTTVAS